MVGCIPILYGTYKYFDDAGEDFYNLWKSLSKEKQQQVDKLSNFFRKLMRFFAGGVVLIVGVTVYSNMQDPDIPLWFNLYFAVVWSLFALVMLYGYFNFYVFGICLIVCISHTANTEIIKIRTNIIQNFQIIKGKAKRLY